MTENMRKTIKYLLTGLMAFATAIAMAQISGYGITGIELMIPCVFVLCFIMYDKVYKLFKTEYKTRVEKDLRFTIPLGVIMAVATVVGSKIDMDDRVFESIGIVDLIYILFFIPFFVSIVQLLFFSADAGKIKLRKADGDFETDRNNIPSATGLNNRAVDNAGLINNDQSKKPANTTHKRSYLRAGIYMTIMIVCWLPYYLTYYPGGIGNDVFESVRMCIGEIPWTNHHPVFFTALINLFISLFGKNDLTIAFGVMAFCQMLMSSATLSCILLWLEKRNLKRGYIYISLSFFALHPIVAMYSIYITKDVLFACVVDILILYILDICRCYHDSQGSGIISSKHWLILGFLSFLTIITRNNGIFMIAALAIAMLLIFRKYWKQIVFTFAIVFALNGLYKGVVWSAMDIEKQSFVESASIPLTQIAYTLYTDGYENVDEDDRDYLESIMPLEAVKEEFAPGYVDSYKFSESFDTVIIDENPGRLLKTWWKMLIPNFGRFVEAYLYETCGYWSYGVSNTVATEGVQPNEVGIEGKDVIASISGHSLDGLLEELVLVARKLPVLCLLSQMAVQILAVILLTRQYIRTGRKKLAVGMVPLIALWVSIMIATPAYCLFRYMCPVFFLWPVLIEEFAAE